MIDNWSNYSLNDLKQGYTYDSTCDCYTCVVCGMRFSGDEVFPIKEHFYQAKKAVQLHVLREHEGMIPVLLKEDKKNIGVTDIQKEILRLLSLGYTDAQIATEMKVAPATIRHTRFVLRERAKQAKLYLALFESVTEEMLSKPTTKDDFVDIHAKATMVDERYAVTTAEEEKIIKSCFSSLEPLVLKTFSTKEKRKLVILRKIITCFETDKDYTEKEVSRILKTIYSDFVTLRRYLIEYGFMERSLDGSSYRRT